MNILTSRYFPCSVKDSAKIRVFGFPYAGAGVTAFDKFLPDMPEWIDFQPIRLPGRENRVSEPTITEVRKLAKIVAHAIRPLLDKPFAFLGICYGGLLAYELMYEIYQQTDWLAQAIFVIAAPAPSLLPRAHPIHDLPDELMIEQLHHMEGMPPDVLNNEELLPIILPAIRGDFRAIETYIPDTNRQSFSVPLVLFGGHADKTVPQYELEAWTALSNTYVRTYYYDGGHFFYNQHYKAIMDVISNTLF